MTSILIKHDGKPIGIVDDCGNGADVTAWFHRRHSFSMSHALEHEGYSAEEIEPDCTDVESLLSAIAERESLTMSAEFVPFSRSRNAAPTGADGKPWESLNWRITLQRYGRDVLTTDYAQGTAHAPAGKMPERTAYERNRKREAVALEIETGRQARCFSVDGKFHVGKPIAPPSIGDVLQSLALDASVLDAGGFEGWAEEFGYDPDSRKAESIYRACLEIATKLRAALGEPLLSEIRFAASFN